MKQFLKDTEALSIIGMINKFFIKCKNRSLREWTYKSQNRIIFTIIEEILQANKGKIENIIKKKTWTDISQTSNKYMEAWSACVSYQDKATCSEISLPTL